MTTNLPNIITVIRILLIPLFVIYLLKNFYSLALIVFTVAGICDGVDGFIARYFNQKTVFGAYLDPIADKALLTSAFISLSILQIIPSWLTVIVISRDIIILVGVVICSLTGKNLEIKPSLASKCTTVIQMLAVFVPLLNKVISGRFDTFLLFWLTATFTIISGMHYIYIGLNVLQEPSSDIDPKN